MKPRLFSLLVPGCTLSCILGCILGCMVSFCPFLDAFEKNEFSPKSVWTDAEILEAEKTPNVIARLYDGNPKTHIGLFDTSRTGKRKETLPPYGDSPITATLVMDLGEVREICGLRFYTANSWKTLGIRNLSVFTCDDAQGKTNVRRIRENEEMLQMNYSLSVVTSWKPVQTRYIGVHVNDAWQIRDQRQGLAPEKAFVFCISEIRCLSAPPADPIKTNDAKTAFPEDRLVRDWLYQDHGFNTDDCFSSPKDSLVEQKMVEKVLTELADGPEIDKIREDLKRLVGTGAPGQDARWKALYLKVCHARRRSRMADLFDNETKLVYVKHHVFGSTEGLGTNMDITDRQYRGFVPEAKTGSELCLLSFHKDGTVSHEVLVSKPNGLIRDPDVSYDAKSLVFSMRDSYNDDFHLYRMDIASRKVVQITFTPEKNGRKYACAEIEPCFAPDGKILFASSRNMQINDCWPDQNGTIYTCDGDGKNIRRLTYDELEISYPQMMNDGRVLFTRWEYSDRNAYYMHPLFTMNPDGTMQTEYCGNNSMFPSSYLQARAIPGSNKVIAIVSGHHVPNKGKLALIDRTLGTQDGKCIEFVAGASPDGTPGRKRSDIEVDNLKNQPAIDHFGQKGPQYQNPFALDEENYLVGFCPEGWAQQSGPYNPPFGVYWMNADGPRELLAFDWRITSTQPVAILERPIPTMKPSQVDLDEKYGTFVVQDVYYGPGLKNIPRGTVKTLRVVALEYRTAWVGTGANAGEIDAGYVQTPISINNGSWDVKHVLGEVDIEEDGSAAFKVPARVPVYFQLLDEKGYTVQTMRSWSTLQPGEIFACLGCHEDKLETGQMVQQRPTPMALKRGAQKLKPFAGKTHPYLERLEQGKPLDSPYLYAAFNSPEGDPVDKTETGIDGFSYNRDVQPIWDRHCISCHAGEASKDKAKPTSLDLTGKKVKIDISDPKILAPGYYKRVAHEFYDGLRTPLYIDWMRDFTQSYVSLTNYGYLKGSKWVQWLECRSRPVMLPPYHTGSCKSPLMKFMEPEHYNVKVSENEKRTVACWIDLLIPFCGSYWEANTWSDKDKATYRYYLEKRRFYVEQELDWIRKSENAPAL